MSHVTAASPLLAALLAAAPAALAGPAQVPESGAAAIARPAQPPASAAEQWSQGSERFGRPGDAIRLDVGYQPYRTEGWSAAIIRALRLHEKYLPAGSTVHFRLSLSGQLIVSRLSRRVHQLGYLGQLATADAVAGGAPVRVVAVTGKSNDLCGTVLVAASAPAFAGTADAARWFATRTVSVPALSCAELFVHETLRGAGIVPAQVLTQNVDLIGPSLKAGLVDAAVVWEPLASRVISEGYARRALEPLTASSRSASFLVANSELIRQRPDVVDGWLRAESEAQRFLADPRNQERVLDILEAQTNGYTREQLRTSLYAGSAAQPTLRVRYPYVVDAASRQVLDAGVAHLHRLGRATVSALPDAAIAPNAAALRARGKAPAGQPEAPR